MTNGRQEIAACTHRYSHQESVGPQMQATCKHGCNRCHDKHCRSIVEKWRHRHCRDKYEGERPPDRQHGCHGRKPPCDQLRSTRRLQGFADGDKRAEHDEDGPFHMLISLSHWQCARQHHEGRRAKERHRHRNEPKGCQTHCQRQYGDWQHTLADAPEPERALRQWKRSEEHTSELQSLMRISYAVFCLTKTTPHNTTNKHKQTTSKLQTQTK